MAFKVPEVQMCLGDRVAGRGTVPRNWARHRPAQLRGTVPRSFVRVSVNHQRLVCLENSRIEPTPEQVRPNFWNWKESEGGVQHRFLCHVVARNLPAEPRNPQTSGSRSGSGSGSGAGWGAPPCS